ncbi:hypothetical protein GCK32_010674 [Trichostrongylus colubriformis]|uniref:Uncharacterized protein n=1 Tax=Trichostrongylus colubriformis TaxID=6319 RepID=A0AAN8IP28_TRICO
MSVSGDNDKGDEKTLRTHNYQDDSLCTDEFEIISCDTLGNGAAEKDEKEDDTMSQWSTKHSIKVESTIPMNNLAHMLCSTHSEVPTLTSGSSFKSVGEVFESEKKEMKGDQSKTLGGTDETAILVGTVRSTRSSVEDSTLIDAPSLTGSYTTLDHVIRSQSETREILEKAIESLDSMNKERTEFASKFASLTNLEEEISSLKSRVAELEQENKMLKQRDLKVGQVLVCEQKAKESNAEDDKIASLKEQLSVVQQQLYARGLEVDSRTKALTDATNELEAAYRKITDLTENLKIAEEKGKQLSEKLDETFALLVAERERVSVAEEEIRCLRAAGGEGFSFPITNEQMVAREMREKAVYAQKLEQELESTRKQLDDLTKRCAGKDDELRTHMEIINVLKEEDGEGRREIAERDRRIKELEEIMHSYLERAEVNNC